MKSNTTKKPKPQEKPAGSEEPDLKNLVAEGILLQRIEARIAKRKGATTAKVPDIDSVSSKLERGKEMLVEGIDELIALLDGKTNMMQEEESHLIPIMSQIFRGAAIMGHVKFKDAARFVMKQVRSMLGDDIADKIEIKNLQAAYINLNGFGEAKEIGEFDSLDELMAEPSKPTNANGSVNKPATNEEINELVAEALLIKEIKRHQAMTSTQPKRSRTTLPIMTREEALEEMLRTTPGLTSCLLNMNDTGPSENGRLDEATSDLPETLISNSSQTKFGR